MCCNNDVVATTGRAVTVTPLSMGTLQNLAGAGMVVSKVTVSGALAGANATGRVVQLQATEKGSGVAKAPLRAYVFNQDVLATQAQPFQLVDTPIAALQAVIDIDTADYIDIPASGPVAFASKAVNCEVQGGTASGTLTLVVVVRAPANYTGTTELTLRLSIVKD